jgi:transcriptional regulator with GAF, ATPase, and Fis domain
LPTYLQSKLLRLIQDKEFERLGDTKTRKVDARIIAATNKDLSQLVKKGKFRENLYYRLKVISIKVPALREKGRYSIFNKLLHRFIFKAAQQTYKRCASGSSKTTS